MEPIGWQRTAPGTLSLAADIATEHENAHLIDVAEHHPGTVDLLSAKAGVEQAKSR